VQLGKHKVQKYDDDGGGGDDDDKPAGVVFRLMGVAFQWAQSLHMEKTLWKRIIRPLP
jgi:hypothetical protein